MYIIMIPQNTCTGFPRSILQSQNPKHDFGAGDKHHLAHIKIFLTYTACIKVVFRGLDHFFYGLICDPSPNAYLKKMIFIFTNYYYYYQFSWPQNPIANFRIIFHVGVKTITHNNNIIYLFLICVLTGF
ncbi:hypothetical protein BpHYR1_034218 [Brachionus plicatilis]|uniref:Uncharacterized protein n=1 Tax=Brachionus plicatilis TaxID=10195 RepID=A0A3M7R2F9_BRAPC|nr:hypothetical protein BpHYR1_034218 [Brachionus plicatilis]